jgi:predicted secreted Zn-dependent protease
MTWRKSTASESGNCVEVSLPEWRKSSRSSDGACVEVAMDHDAVLVRDSKAPTGRVLRFNRHEWAAFLAGVRAGEFDLEEP